MVTLTWRFVRLSSFTLSRDSSASTWAEIVVLGRLSDRAALVKLLSSTTRVKASIASNRSMIVQ